MSIWRSASALVTLCAIVFVHMVSSVGPVLFTCLTAAILSFGFITHSLQPRSRFRVKSADTLFSDQLSVSTSNRTSLTGTELRHSEKLVPALSESLQQLHDLQSEINQLQAQFKRDAANRGC